MLIDTHAHVNFAAFKDDADFAIKRALEEDTWVVNVGTQIDTSKAAVAMAEKFSNPSLNPSPQKGREINRVFAVVGLHPVHTYSQHIDEEESHFKTREEHFDTATYRSMAQNPKVVGIGECGLDYYRLPQDMNHESGIMNHEEIKENQKQTFIEQIRLAKELDKALCIHCRPSVGTQDAYEDILAILDAELQNPNDKLQILNEPLLASPLEKGRKTAATPSLHKRGQGEFRFEIHSFTGSVETAQKFLKRGAYVGLNGIITFDKTGNMEKVVQAVPLDRIVLETDCPYLGPVPFRGKRNEPAYVKYVAEKVAKIKGFSIEEVSKATTDNARAMFKI